MSKAAKARNADRRRWRVLIPDGDSPFALLVAQSLKRGDPSMQIHAAYVDPHALVRFSRYVDRCLPMPAEGTVDYLYELLKHQQYDLVLPVSGPGIAFVARHYALLGDLARIAMIPQSSLLDLVNDKWTFFQALHQAGVPVPPTVLVDAPSCAEQLQLGVPLILKPRHGSGGQGIVKFANEAEFKPREQEFMGDGHPYIMQVFIEGYDIGRSVLACNGRVLASTVQQPTRRGFRPTGPLHFLRDKAVEEMADHVVAALNWTGVAHIDLRYDERTATPMVIEMNARYWSSMMGSLVAGVNFPLEQVRASLIGPQDSSPSARDVHYVKITDWPSYYLEHRTPLSHSNLSFNLNDPVAKLMKWLRPSSSMGRGGA